VYGPVRAEWPGVVDRNAVVERQAGTILVDVRSAERYRGEVEPIDPIAGHIPGAVNVPHTDDVSDDGRLLAPDELATRFAAAGIANGDETIVYCGSGVTSCQTILAMELAGLGRARLYPGSWSDWSSAGLPIATG
jgi:thiosulfate/3-mercaptopyruvate sulfurtransferase